MDLVSTNLSKLPCRERYRELVKQCQMMHSSIGTGSLAYVVGSKVMDMRTMFRSDGRREAEVNDNLISDDTNNLEKYSEWDHNCTDTPCACERESSSDSADLVSVRESLDSAVYDSSGFIPSSSPYNCHSPKLGSSACGSEFVTENYFDFPPLPVTDLFEKRDKDREGSELHDSRLSTRRKLQFEDEHMHSFQINNNIDLIMESNGSPSNNVSQPINCEIEMGPPNVQRVSRSNNLEYKREIVDRLRISDVPETPMINAGTSEGGVISEERVSEWLWTLHRIVRTDSHLEFYEDTKNLARMSDILAVYAWVDPATGYCQGQCGCFWCFEMLIRRMRKNFQMEGPTGVMKQLEVLWRILEVTDKEIFAHISHIGAESLHFAFRMLLVLFRREISFNEALRMWEEKILNVVEMMWAADFDESVACNLEEDCLEALVIQMPRESGAETGEESVENENSNIKGVLQPNQGNTDHSNFEDNAMKSVSNHPFCGLTRNFWSKHDSLQMCTEVSRNGEDELPVFCVAVILIMNRQKIIRETRSIDDLIKLP
ncbi:unnamed protein product [Thlaspi arvense]|uniref:Rab-GAP TBC domain-containing protein n=1 Tax=Thlaspi arvense TaxID=13288 RepID=A0AAU9RXI7_THLAR|nr:unnamed protein product [Thlaspi arvense]